MTSLVAEGPVDPKVADEAIDITSGVKEGKPESEINKKQPEVEYAVKVSEQEGKIIDEILTTMGSSSVLSLGFKRTYLKELGKKITGIGSLQFLGYIAEHQDLKRHLKTIHESMFKWRGFMDGLRPGLEKEADRETLFAEIPAFAEKMGANSEQLAKLAKERKWDEFVMEAVNP